MIILDFFINSSHKTAHSISEVVVENEIETTGRSKMPHIQMKYTLNLG